MKPIKGSYLSNLYIILTYWPQPAFILLVKICKNPVLELTSYRKPNLGPAQLTKIEPKSGSGFEQKIEPKGESGSNRARNRAKKWRNSLDQKEFSKKPLHTIRILGLTSYIVVVFFLQSFLAKKLFKFT